ncbi:hypothetical protein V6N12_028818 [Hibiscus sabdariffa]|uniref:Reverse transcriptase zinc-binding domain-containing protein n=1 Tax=Hibiscus sabdariffa TaxID=183260 RepID=A0ABR2F6Z8_9ROSI
MSESTLGLGFAGTPEVSSWSRLERQRQLFNFDEQRVMKKVKNRGEGFEQPGDASLGGLEPKTEVGDYDDVCMSDGNHEGGVRTASGVPVRDGAQQPTKSRSYATMTFGSSGSDENARLNPVVRANGNQGIRSPQKQRMNNGSSGLSGERTLGASVISMIPGRVPIVISNGIPGSTNQHQEITIVEEGDGREGGTDTRSRVSLKGAGKNKVQFKKKFDPRGSDWVPPSEWSDTINIRSDTSRRRDAFVDDVVLGAKPPDASWMSEELPQEGAGIADMMSLMRRVTLPGWWIREHPRFRDELLRCWNQCSVRHATENPFRFVFAWQEHPRFRDELLRCWNQCTYVLVNLQTCSDTFTAWNESVFGHIGWRKMKLIARLRAVKLPSGYFLDTIGWGSDVRRIFTVTSAYSMLANDAQEGESHLRNIIAKYRGLPRIRMLLWLILKGRILTNSERFRRHMTNNPCCGVCGALEENLSYLFWDCVEARILWARVVKEERLAEFLSLDFQTWLADNIRNQQQFSIHPKDWDIAFGTYLWNIWVNRNYSLFSPELVSSEGIYHRSLWMIVEFGRSSSLLRLNQRSSPIRASTVASWEATPARCIKVNTDGWRNTVSGLATCGGVGRDSESRWCFGFAKGIGSCSCLEVELWGIYEGLAIAWS